MRGVGFAGAHHREARGRLAARDDAHGRELRHARAVPVLGIGGEAHLDAAFERLEAPRAGADGIADHLVAAIGQPAEVAPGEHPHVAVAAAERREEGRVHFLERDSHGPGVGCLDRLDRLQEAAEGAARVRRAQALEGEHHVVGRERLAVVPGDAFAQAQREGAPVRPGLPALRQAARGGELAGGVRADQRVEQVAEIGEVARAGLADVEAFAREGRDDEGERAIGLRGCGAYRGSQQASGEHEATEGGCDHGGG
jgi:hypothetical protein